MPNRPYRITPTLRSQMLRATNTASKSLQTMRVERVLTLLTDERLSAEAAHADRSERSLLIDCPDAALVWNDHRVTSRLKQLQEEGVKVERTIRKIVTIYAEMERVALKISF